jgi:hypothetical protein
MLSDNVLLSADNMLSDNIPSDNMLSSDNMRLFDNCYHIFFPESFTHSIHYVLKAYRYRFSSVLYRPQHTLSQKPVALYFTSVAVLPNTIYLKILYIKIYLEVPGHFLIHIYSEN